MERKKTCCFTGHRPGKLPWGYNETDPACLRLKRTLADVLSVSYAEGFRRFICGMAMGTDMYFGEAVAALREVRTDIRLEAAIPFDGQEKKWAAELQRRYRRLVEASDDVTILRGAYTPTCMMERNRYMVDRSSLLIAVYDGRPGGTKNTLDYAAREGLGIIRLPVDGLELPDRSWL